MSDKENEIPSRFIQQLAQAIRDSINQEGKGRIEKIIERIEAEGFEVVFKVEATMGFNRVEPSEDEIPKIVAALVDKDGNIVPGLFTSQDRKLFRKMRVIIPKDESPKDQKE